MIYYSFKIVVTTLLIIAISEIAKKSSFAGALLASIPIVSVLAMFWLYVDTRDVAKVSALSSSVFWLVLPSLVLFLLLPILLNEGMNFYLSISLSLLATALCYWGMVAILSHYGIRL